MKNKTSMYLISAIGGGIIGVAASILEIPIYIYFPFSFLFGVGVSWFYHKYIFN